jgi:hypothetical protein
VVLRLTRNEAPEIGANIRQHQYDNAVFAMFLADIEDDVRISTLTDDELGHRFAQWCDEW